MFFFVVFFNNKGLIFKRYFDNFDPLVPMCLHTNIHLFNLAQFSVWFLDVLIL